MHHHIRRKLLAAITIALVAQSAAAAAPALAGTSERVSGYVYVNDNTPGSNTVAGFAQHPDGRLTQLPGSPFPTGGAGTGDGLASQGAIQVSSDRRYVIAVDAGSDEVSVLRIKHDGRLKPVPGGVVSSNGMQPVSVAEHRGLVYVANAGAGGSNYTGFALSSSGRLRPLSGSTVALPDEAQPGDVLFDPSGTHLIGARVNSSQIDSFRVGRDGRIAPAPGSPIAAQAAGPLGSAFRPTGPRQLFVSNAHAGPGAGTVSAFDVARDGALSPIVGSPFADGRTAPCWVEITHDGRHLFVVDTGSGTISRYAISADGALELLGSTPVDSRDDVGAVDARLSRDGRTLYLNESKASVVGVFRVQGDRLTRTGSAALPDRAAAAGVAVR